MTAERVAADVTDDESPATVPTQRKALTTRDRLLDAAVRMTTDDGWASVTMSRLAATAGVSRQTVYNDIGTRPALAEAMIQRETERFLSCVSRAFEAEDTLLGGVRAATCAVLERAKDNVMLRAIISATHDADTELLPLLTSRSEGLMEYAIALVKENVARYDHGLTPAELAVATEAVVRSVLSHLMHPSKEPEETADDIAWLTARVLGREVPARA